MKCCPRSALVWDSSSLLSSITDSCVQRMGPCHPYPPGAGSLGQLRTIYEAILGKTLDKRNFRRKIADLGIPQAAEGISE